MKLEMWPGPESKTQKVPLQPVLTAQAPSRLSSPTRQAAVDPTALNIEDTEDTDDEDTNPRRPQVSVFEVIKTKFIQGLSRVLDIKSHSQPTVVRNSQEDLARRAELKRLMHKRIRDELRSEAESNDGTTPVDNSDLHEREQATQSELPRRAVRDTIEFSAEEMKEIKSNGLKCSPSEDTSLSTPVNAQLSTPNLQNSIPASTRHSVDTVDTEEPMVVTRGSLSRVPESPQLVPVKVSSSRNSSSTHSWHLDYSAEQLTSMLGIDGGSTRQSLESTNPDDDAGGASMDKTSIKNDDRKSQESHPPASSLDDITSLNARRSTAEEGRHFDTEDEDEQVYVATLHEGSLEMWLRSQDVHPSLDDVNHRSRVMSLVDMPESCTKEIEGTSGDNHMEHDTRKQELEECHKEDARNSLPRNVPLTLEPSVDTAKPSHELNTHDLNVALAEQPGQESNSEQILSTPQVPQEELSSDHTSPEYKTKPNSVQPSRKNSHLGLKELFGGSKGSSWTHTPLLHRKF